jgi:hypothetical protein
MASTPIGLRRTRVSEMRIGRTHPAGARLRLAPGVSSLSPSRGGSSRFVFP